MNDPQVLYESWHIHQPSDIRRRSYAELLARQSIEFIFLHELGHVFHGHLGWIGGGQSSAIEEMPHEIQMSGPANTLPSALDSQTLEMDADSFAAHAIASTFHDLKWNDEISKKFSNTADDWNAAFLQAAAMLLFFKCLEAKTGRTDDRTSSHPASWVRRTYLRASGLRFFESYAPHLADKYLEIVAMADLELIKAINLFTNKPVKMELVMHHGELSPLEFVYAENKLQRLLDHWKILRPKLQPFLVRGSLSK